MSDDNEGSCGACRRVGDLLCCEGCPAAFHIRCAGYSDDSELPYGDWYCWFCAKERDMPYQHPNSLFKAPRQANHPVMLASDDTAELFYRCRPLAISDKYIELQYMDIEHEDEIVERSSVRLWHGTTDKNAWTIVEAVAWRPNCRLFQVDKEALAGGAAAGTATDTPGVNRVPAGEIGAGLPVSVGGAGKEQFNAALSKLWRSLLGPSYPERMPACLLCPGHPVEPWHLWREVWAWGGPDAVSRHKLWATVGFSFNTPFSSTAVSSRVRKSYEAVIEPLDQAVDEGTVQLQRPQCTRQPKDRALQLRPPLEPQGRPLGVPRVRAAARHQGGSSKSRRWARSRKRRRGNWSSDDDAPDMNSEFESDNGSGVSDEYGNSESSEEKSQEPAASPSKRRLASTVANSRATAKEAAAATARVELREVKESIKDAVARPVVTQAAQQMRVGQVVDFRTWQLGAHCATGWRSGTIVAVEPGSIWEGGSRFLIHPRQTHHSSSRTDLLFRSQASMPQLPTENPAAAALAAVAAAGGPSAGEAAAHAAQKLLTPSGHLRHEVAGLVSSPRKPASAAAPAVNLAKLSLAHAGSGGSDSTLSQGQQQRQPQLQQGQINASGAAGAQTADEQLHRPAWVPLLWRGTAQQPLPKPLVMVRPHHVAAAQPSPSPVPPNTSSVSPFAKQQQQVLSVQQLSTNMLVEALHQGSWWPAQVLEVKAEARGQQQQLCGGSEPSSSVPGVAPAAAAASCVLLKNLDPPEADGLVWRCGTGHAVRAAHPQHATGYGVLAAVQDDIMPLSQVRKQIAPYTYAGGIQAFACLSHLRDPRRV